MSRKIKVLFSEQELAERTAQMGVEITEYFRGSDLTGIVLTNGAVPFAADLIRKIDLPMYVDSLAVSSYHKDKRTDELVFRSELKLDPKGRKILLMDEVLDSGRTLRKVRDYLLERGAIEVKSAVIVTKKIQRKADALDHADWSGFEAEDLYLVGYGLDSDEYYRNLPYIGVMTEE